MTRRTELSTRRLPILNTEMAEGPSETRSDSPAGQVSAAAQAPLGVLSIHIDGTRCRVACPFCYLGARDGHTDAVLDVVAVTEALQRLSYREVAIAVSEPVAAALPVVAAVRAAARAPLSITTTMTVAVQHPSLFDGVARVNLSVDPHKGRVSTARMARFAAALKRRHPALELVLVVSLSTPEFAEELLGGLLDELVALEAVDRVALNGLKPPPPWCDRAFWLHALHRLRPLLARALDRRLFLDCYVAARILGVGPCPARPDLSPAPSGLAFRGCVYQAAPDFVAADAATLARRLVGFTAPAACPFPIT